MIAALSRPNGIVPADAVGKLVVGQVVDVFTYVLLDSDLDFDIHHHLHCENYLDSGEGQSDYHCFDSSERARTCNGLWRRKLEVWVVD